MPAGVIMTDSAVEEARAASAGASQAEEVCVQSAGFLLELSLDWLVLRASENVDDFLGVSHVIVVDEPLGRFIQAQPLHDLRNLFSRISATTGVARAYGVRLTEDQRRFDIAFQLSDGRALLEGMPAREGVGELFGTIGGLAEGLRGLSGSALLEAAARRMRALTGFDRAAVTSGDQSMESSRGGSASAAAVCSGLPPIVADTSAMPVPIFPRRPGDRATMRALMRSPSPQQLEQLRAAGVASALRVPMGNDGCFECDSRTPREASLELHAAAELYAQIVALRLEIDALRTRPPQ